MSLLNVLILGIVQGLAELLPISSSAHVVVTEKLLGLDPASPPLTLLLVMLHTGTMCAVIVYFWRPWRASYFRSAAVCKRFLALLALATLLTGLIGGGAALLVEHTLLRGVPHAQVEDLFDHLELIAPALAAVGVLIIIAGLRERRRAAQSAAQPVPHPAVQSTGELSARQAGLIGAIQGLSLPFRGFSRSGATISAGMLLGVAKVRAEVFSFALAVVLTPPVVAREAWRLVRAAGAGNSVAGGESLGVVAARTLLGALVAFLAGLAALRWLSRWLERGRWHLFGIYCLLAAVAVGVLHHFGY